LRMAISSVKSMAQFLRSLVLRDLKAVFRAYFSMSCEICALQTTEQSAMTKMEVSNADA